MTEKIKQLAKSPAMGSDDDVQNFVKLMELGEAEENLLLQAKSILKKYYLNGSISPEEEQIVDRAILVVSGEALADTTDGSVQNVPEIDEELAEDIGSIQGKIWNHLLYRSPAFALVQHYFENEFRFDEMEDRDELMNAIENLSDKFEIEKRLESSEEEMIEMFVGTVTALGEHYKSFTFDESTIASLQQAMMQYRSIVMPTINEIYAYSQQIKNYVAQNQESSGQLIESFIRGGMLGHAGAMLFGPVGAVAAVGATYLNGVQSSEKENAVFDNLLNKWGEAIISLYLGNKVKNYYLKYENMLDSISGQFTKNFLLEANYAAEKGKEAFEKYKSDIKQFRESFENTITEEMVEEFENTVEFINDIQATEGE